MRKYLYCENGFVEKENWIPNCWVNVECPTADDFRFLQEELHVPESFLNDIADTTSVRVQIRKELAAGHSENTGPDQ